MCGKNKMIKERRYMQRVEVTIENKKKKIKKKRKTWVAGTYFVQS